MPAFNDRISGSAFEFVPVSQPATPFAERLEPAYEDETSEEETPFLSLDESEGSQAEDGDPYQAQFRVRTEGDVEYEGSGSGKRKRTMAQFDPALQRTLKEEAGYANHPNDRGGETYRGVARNIHKQWSGWKIVDAYKGKPNFPATLDQDKGLQSLVIEFYRTEFWNKIKGDSIPNQTLANELFDSAVNFGVGPAVTLLQRALNFLGKSDRVATNGGMGTDTMKALNIVLATPRNTKALLGALVSLRGQRYMNIMCDDPTQRIFAVGWFSRLSVG